MMLTIAIIAGVSYIASLIHNVTEHDKFHVSGLIAAILVLSTWECLPLAITVMGLTVLINTIGIIIRD